MKQVIFVCLLSLTVCLSQPNTDATTQAPAAATTQNATAAETKPIETKQPEHLAANATEGTITPNSTVVTAGAQNATSANNSQNQTTTTPNETSPKANDTNTAVKPNSTPLKPADTTAKPDQKENNETKTGPATNGTNADGKDSKKNETTTPKGEIVSPTAAPVEAKSRAFDGPSFIGGIILTLGLLAIGFMGFKYYKNQTERNYHTL